MPRTDGTPDIRQLHKCRAPDSPAPPRATAACRHGQRIARFFKPHASLPGCGPVRSATRHPPRARQIGGRPDPDVVDASRIGTGRSGYRHYDTVDDAGASTVSAGGVGAARANVMARAARV
ncbi:hypothetical protein [uncultured Tateyamaria sp.]|uniref:hypothetical protein n=1 Tax=uncultured Tateyamaria sp. TaxID=455651 RepID=UPI002628864E|nr:hypothetical protein [uncultured Tateyamaria sp.]